MIGIAVAVLFVLHGMIHLFGFAKAFEGAPTSPSLRSQYRSPRVFSGCLLPFFPSPPPRHFFSHPAGGGPSAPVRW